MLLHRGDPILERVEAFGLEHERLVVATLEARGGLALLLGHVHRLHALAAIGRLELEAERAVVADDLDVLERDEAGGRDVLGRLEIVEHVPREDRVPLLPRLDPPALLVEPTLLHRRDELALLELDLVGQDRLVQLRQDLVGQVGAVLTDAAVVTEELLLRHLVDDLIGVQIRVQHDHREGKHVRRVGRSEDMGMALGVALGKRLHDPINLLRLAR
mmetsp:Transcript_20536/g.53924  ORF Transcript_20536/g.53924 Transcript_20536/m.53924 type:complete len:216 (-) Transcript_20536:558-1205(-)